MTRTRSATRPGRRRADVLHPLEDPRLLLLPSNLLILLGLAGAVLLATRGKRAGLRMVDREPRSARDRRLLPGRRLPHSRPRKPLSGLGCPRGAPDGIIVLGGAISVALKRVANRFQRQRVTILAIAKLARAFPDARIVYSGGDASLFGNGVPKPTSCPALDSFGVPRSAWAGDAIAQYRRERRVHQGAGRSKAGRALAAGDLGPAHAARGRLLPEDRLFRRGLSGRLARCGRALECRTGADSSFAGWPGALDSASYEWYWSGGVLADRTRRQNCSRRHNGNRRGNARYRLRVLRQNTS